MAALLFLFLGPAALILLLNTNFHTITSNENWLTHLGALALLGILGTAFAMLLMYSLIRYTSAVYASSVTYIIPVFAIIWGLLDNEAITLFYILFMSIVLLGVYLINRKS